MGRPQKPDSYSNKYWVRDMVRYKIKHAVYRVNLKLQTLTHYGPNGVLQCSWSGCTVNDVDMLVLDHIQNDGKNDRKTRGTGIQLYQVLRNEGFPAGFQTLCCNHNQKKETMRSRGIV